MTRTVLVLGGGAPLTDRERSLLPSRIDVLVAADRGIDEAHRLDLPITVGVGDFDSVTAKGLARAERDGITLHRATTDKDETDLELALTAAREHDPGRLVVAGISGGRLDHLLAALHTLTTDALATVDVDAIVDDCRISVVRHRRTMTGRVGDVMSLIPIGGDVAGVRTNGLRYPLHDEPLRSSAGRGVSNVLDAPMVVVTISGGVLLAVQPPSATDTP